MPGRTGLSNMTRAIKDAATRSENFSGGSLNYFSLGDGESIIVRFLTDVEDILETQFYEFVQGNNGKPQSFIVAPDFYADDPDWRGEDWVLKYGGRSKDYKTKELEAPKAKTRLVALVVEREEYAVDSATGGRPKMRTRDKLIDVEDREGKTHRGRNFVVIRQAPKFWSSLVTYHEDYGTLCDRDYKIVRTGKQLDTTYTITPKGGSEDPDWKDDGTGYEELHRHYGYGTGKDADGKEIGPEDPERFLYCPQTLMQWAEYQSSEDRAKRALTDVKEEARERHNGDGGTLHSGDDEAQAASASSSSDVSALRARLERHQR